MADYPDFQSGVWDHRDLKSKDVEIKYTVYVPATDLDPMTSQTYTVYTVPAGKRYFVSDCYGSMKMRGSIAVYVPGSHDIYSAYFEPYDTHFASLRLPIPVETGEEIRFFVENTDRVKGTFRVLLGIWYEPGSHWIPPKEDDPLERFKKGDWNFGYYFLNPDGSYSVIFRRADEEKSNYLRLEKPYTSKEKKLASFHLKPEEPREIIDIINTKPEKVKEILKKLEDHAIIQ